MAAIERIHHTGFTVSNLDRSLAFYRDLLGCEVLATQEKQGGYLRRLGVTTIYVTHDQTEAMMLGQRVAVLDKGVI